jgi:peptidoglycan-N-acetylglucosamine deacetylase
MTDRGGRCHNQRLMKDESVHARPRAPRQLLTKSELTARRTASRRRRAHRRRRGAGVIAVAAIAAGTVFAVTSGGGSPAAHEAGRIVAATPSPPARQTAAHRPTTTTAQGSTNSTTPRHARAQHAAPHASVASVNHVLRYTSYVQLAGHRRREVALTFDDGPSPYTHDVLRILRRMRVHATFFVVGREVAMYKRLVADEYRAGNDVGDHTMSHPPLDQLSVAAQSEEIGGDARLIKAAGAPAPRLMRPPYGSFNATTLQVLRAQRLLMVLWSVDTKDYSRPGTDRIVYTAVSGAEPGAIILMHDGGGERSETVAALPRIINRLRQRHYTLVTLSQLVKDDPPPRHQPAPVSLSGGV